MTLKKMLVITMILSIVFTISACNITKKDTEPVEIHIMLPRPTSNSPGTFNTDKVYIDTIANFQKLNPLIKVVIDRESPTDLNKLPEIMQYDSSFLEMAEKKGLLLDLLKIAGTKEIDIYENILDSVMINGKMLIMPYTANPMVVLYNKSFFDAARISYPQDDWTWEQFSEISKQFKPAQGSAIAYEPLVFELLMESAGKKIVSSTGETSVGYLDSPEAVRTFQWLNQYYHDVDKQSPMSWMDAGILFNNLRTGMALGNMESYAFYKINLKDDIGVASLPHFEGGKRANPISIQGYGISTKSKHPKEAWKLIEFITLTKHENAMKFAEYYLTVSKSMSEATNQLSDPIKRKFANELNYAMKPSNNFIYSQSMNTLSKQFAELLTVDKIDIPVKLHSLAQALDKEMNRLKIKDEQKTENPSP